MQVEGNKGVFIARVPAQRYNYRHTALLNRKHTGNMHQRFMVKHIHQRANLGFLPQTIEVAIQFRLLIFNQTRQRNGGTHIGDRIVRLTMIQAVGRGQVLELKAFTAVVMLRPDNTLGAQSIGAAHHIE